MKVKHFFWVLLIMFDSCVEPLDVPVMTSDKLIVVDGMITDKEGPYVVRLNYSKNLDESLRVPDPVTGAVMSIQDNHGHVQALSEGSPGVYTTPASYRGVIGNTYTLAFTTPDGKKYESTPAKLKPAGNLDQVHFGFRENVINHTDISKPQDAFFLYANATATSESTKLFRWRWKATYHVFTEPHLRMTYPPGSDTPVPDPISCSGYVSHPEYGLIQIAPCSCCDCWVTLLSRDIVVSNPQIISSNTFSNILLGRLAADPRYFYEKIVVQVEQFSMDEEVHTFWNRLKIQDESSESIFQPNVIKINGNIRCVSDPSEEVLGIFSVSGVTEKMLTILPTDVPKPFPPYESIIADCRAYSGGTNQRPSFW